MTTSSQDNLPGERSTARGPLAAHFSAEKLMLSEVLAWADAFREARSGEEEGVTFSTLVGVLEDRAAQAREVLPWEDLTEEKDRELASALLPEAISEDRASLQDAHLGGWFLQAFHAARRADSFASHHARETKHATSSTSTQLYTPRWIADFMAITSLSMCAQADTPPTVCDPCMGGGQMLLAALDRVAVMYPEASARELVSALYGVDLDPRAVRVARAAIWMRLQEVRDLSGEDHGTLRALLVARLTEGDGLTTPGASVDVVLTNPPYMGLRSMPPAQKKSLKERWHPFHHDLYMAFMRRAFELAPAGVVGLLTQQTVWYLSRFERARRWLLERGHLTHFAHIGHGAFAALSGEKASVTATIHRVGVQEEDARCAFIDLRERGEEEARRDALAAWLEQEEDAPGARAQPLDSFHMIPGRPLAHWLPAAWRELFASTNPRLEELATVPGSQNKTGRNATYVKKWAEVPAGELAIAERLGGAAPSDKARWFFYSKGGKFAPWWGNWDHVVDWSDAARAHYKKNATSNLLDASYWGREGLCYTDFGGRLFNARWMPAGCLFDMAGPAIFVDEGMSDAARRRRLLAILAVLNASPTKTILNALNPSLHYQVRDVRNLPMPDWSDALEEELAELSGEMVEGVRALHLLREGDPLFDARYAEEPGVLERAVILSDALCEAWRAIDLRVCEAYGVPELASEPPEELHHLLGKLDLPER